MKSLASFTLVVLAFFFQSCSIEKRHYTNGFHVEWNHRNKVNFEQKDTTFEVAISEANRTEIIESENVKPDDESHKTKERKEIRVRHKEILRTNSSKTILAKHHRIASIRSGITAATNNANNIDVPLKHKGASRSLTLGMMTWILLITNIIARNAELFYLSPYFGLFFSLLALLFAVLAVSIGKSAQREIDQQPGKYSNRSQAAVGIALGMVYLILLLVALLLAIVIILALSGF